MRSSSTRISFINEIANVCELVGADVVERRARRWPRPSPRPALPQGRHRLRRLVLPEGRHSRSSSSPANSGYPFLLLTPLGGERAAEARVVQEAPAAPRKPARQDASRCSGLAFKPNTDDMREAPSRVLAGASDRRRARRCAAGIRSRGPTICPAWSSATPSLDAVRGADAAVDRDRVAGAARVSRPTKCARRCAGRSSSTAATSSIPPPSRPRLRVRGDRPADEGDGRR